MPWLLDEDEMLKLKLTGLKVYDAKAPVGGAGRDVKVWFRFPEQEERSVTYPFLTIDQVGIAEALDRAHRGGSVRPTASTYAPPEMTGTPAPGKVFTSDWPVAMDITYQVSSWSRIIQHDRAIVAQLWNLFPGRFGHIGGNVTPYVRPVPAQLLGYTTADRIDEFGKRLFRKIFTIKVFSELWASQVREITQVTAIDIVLPPLFGGEDWFGAIDCHE